MPEFDIVFEKLEIAIRESEPLPTILPREASAEELDEIDELRRFSADLHEVQRPVFTTT